MSRSISPTCQSLCDDFSVVKELDSADVHKRLFLLRLSEVVRVKKQMEYLPNYGKFIVFGDLWTGFAGSAFLRVDGKEKKA